MEIPLIDSVPSWPTMMLSRRFTKFVIPFWTIMGTATASTIL